jgi:hypothetical protein
MPFDVATRTRVLLWCDRHCCLCKKQCGINIEVHHIVPEGEGGSDELDNAIPLCFDCHSWVQHYNQDHPRGTKYKPEELRARREQVFEEFTRHLVPPIHYELTQLLSNGKLRQFPDVGFSITHPGDSLPVKARVRVRSEHPTAPLSLPSGYYTGEKLWHLNPRFTINGHFEIPWDRLVVEHHLTLQVAVSIIDPYEREHQHLPLGYSYVPEQNLWYLEPWASGA